MGDQIRKHEDHWEQGRVLLNALGNISPQQFNKRSLHSASRTIYSEIPLIKACSLVPFEPVNKSCVCYKHGAKVQKNMRRVETRRILEKQNIPNLLVQKS